MADNPFLMVSKKKWRLEEERGKIGQSKERCFSYSGFPACIHLCSEIFLKVVFWPPVIKYMSPSDMDSSVVVLGLFWFFFLIHALESITTGTRNAANLITPFLEKVLPFPCGLFFILLFSFLNIFKWQL